MPTEDSIQRIREERRRQRENALARLGEIAAQKPPLKRPGFFVPGWTDEECGCWMSAYRKGDMPTKEWLAGIAPNCEDASFVTFTTEESKRCRSFLDFADLLKHRIWDKIGKRTGFDLVGHSMGGLDSVAAIIDEDGSLLNVHSLVTVATPHQGSELGEIGPKFRNYAPHHAIQCVNLDPDELPIQMLNKLETRQRFLESVSKLYCLMGTRDQAVMASARYSKVGLPAGLYDRKVEIVEIGGATHSQARAITQDPRAVLNVFRILLDIELEKPGKNYGFIYRKSAR